MEVLAYCSGTGSTKSIPVNLAESAQFAHLGYGCCFVMLKTCPLWVEKYALNLVWISFNHRVILALEVVIPHQKYHNHMIQIIVQCQLGQTCPKYF